MVIGILDMFIYGDFIKYFKIINVYFLSYVENDFVFI